MSKIIIDDDDDDRPDWETSKDLMFIVPSIQMTNEHRKRDSHQLVIREMQIETASPKNNPVKDKKKQGKKDV